MVTHSEVARQLTFPEHLKLFSLMQLTTGQKDLSTGRLKLPGYMLFGMALALGHARSGEPALIAGYLGQSKKFDDAMVRFARKYADLNQKDYEAFSQAIHAGELPVSEVF